MMGLFGSLNWDVKEHYSYIEVIYFLQYKLNILQKSLLPTYNFSILDNIPVLLQLVARCIYTK